MYELLLKDIRGRHDPVSFADLGKKPYTPPPVFFLEARPGKNLSSTS